MHICKSWLGGLRLAGLWCGHAVAFALEELLSGLELGGDFGLLVGLLFLGVVVGRSLSSGIGDVVVECKLFFGLRTNASEASWAIGAKARTAEVALDQLEAGAG